MAHRFFIPPTWINPPFVTLQGETAHQIKNVLRMRPGHEITVLDNSGRAWQVKLITIGKDTVQGEIVSQQATQNEPTCQLTLYQGTLKGEKFEWVLQKGTELGISQFVPMVCQRSVVRDNDLFAKKQTRWQRIIQEAAEQSGREKLPCVGKTVSFAEAIQQIQPSDLAIMAWEESSITLGLKEVLTTKANHVALFIGPEGGFTSTEVLMASEVGVQVVTLGGRILRAETASLAVSAVIFYELDQWQKSYPVQSN